MKDIDLSDFAISNAKIIEQAFRKLHPDRKDDVVGVMVCIMRSDEESASHSYGYFDLSVFDRQRIASDLLVKSLEELGQAKTSG